MSLIKSFSKDTLLYGIGNALKKFIGVLLLPFYTRALSPDDYGILETLGSLTMLLTIIVGLRMVDAGSRYYYSSEDRQVKGTILYTVFIICIITIVPCLLLSFFSASISSLLFGNREYSGVVFISLMTVPIIILNDEQTWIYRYLRLPWKYNFYILTKSLLNVGFGIALVIVLKKGVIGAQLATLLSSLAVVIFSLFLFGRFQYHFIFSFEWAKKMFLFSSPLLLSGILTWSYTLLDRFLLLGLKSTYDVGIYSIGSTFARPISVLNMAIGMSFYPFFMAIYEKDKSVDYAYTKENSNKIWYLYLAISLSLCSFLSVFGKDLISFIATPEYLAGATIIPFLVLSGIVRQSIDLTSIGMFLKEKTIHYTWLVLVTTGISVGLNLFLIPVFGFIGAAISNLTSNIVYFIIAYRLSQRYFPVKRKTVKVVFYMLLVSLVSMGIPILDYQQILQISLFGKASVFLTTLLLPFAFGLLNIQSIRSFINSEK